MYNLKQDQKNIHIKYLIGLTRSRSFESLIKINTCTDNILKPNVRFFSVILISYHSHEFQTTLIFIFICSYKKLTFKAQATYLFDSIFPNHYKLNQFHIHNTCERQRKFNQFVSFFDLNYNLTRIIAFLKGRDTISPHKGTKSFFVALEIESSVLFVIHNDNSVVRFFRLLW